MDFYSAYRQGFVRVAACTHHTTIADPAANAESVLRVARDCHDDGVALAIFPELTLSGYSIEDILLQDALLDAVEDGAARRRRGRRPSCCRCWSSAPRCATATGSTTRAVVIHRGAVLGVVPKSYLPTYREFYERRQMAPGDDVRRRRSVLGGTADVPFGPDLLFAATDLPGLRAARRDLRGHVGAGPAERAGGAGGRDGAGQPVRQPDHDRARRRPQAAGALGVVALPGRLRLRGGG